MKTQEEYEVEMRYKRGDRFVVERHITLDYKRNDVYDFLSAGDEIKIIGYGQNEYRGIGYLVERSGVRFDRPLPRKCLERYCWPLEEK